MPTVNVPNIGRLIFPEGMSEADMLGAIDENFPNWQGAPFPEQPAAERTHGATGGWSDTGKGVVMDSISRLGRETAKYGGEAISGVAGIGSITGAQALPRNLRSIRMQAAMAGEDSEPAGQLVKRATKEAPKRALTRREESLPYQIGKEIQEVAQEQYQPNPAMDNTIRAKLISGIASTIPVVASGPLAPITYAGIMGESGAKEAEAKGATPEQIVNTFLANAALGVTSEFLLGVPYLLRSIKAVKGEAVAEGASGITKRLATIYKEHPIASLAARGAIAEAIQEGPIEATGQNAIAKWVGQYDPERPIFQNVAEQAAYGAAIGMLFGGAFGAASSFDLKRKQKEAMERLGIDIAARESLDPRNAQLTRVGELSPEVPLIDFDAELAHEASSRDRLQQRRQVAQAQATPEVLEAPIVDHPPGKVEVTPRTPTIPAPLPVRVPSPKPPKKAPPSAPPTQIATFDARWKQMKPIIDEEVSQPALALHGFSIQSDGTILAYHGTDRPIEGKLRANELRGAYFSSSSEEARAYGEDAARRATETPDLRDVRVYEVKLKPGSIKEVLYDDEGNAIPGSGADAFITSQAAGEIEIVNPNAILSYRQILGPKDLVSKPTPITPLPKLRRGEKQGDVFATQEEPLALVGEKGKDFERIAREQASAVQAKAEAERIARENQRPLFAREGPVIPLWHATFRTAYNKRIAKGMAHDKAIWAAADETQSYDPTSPVLIDYIASPTMIDAKRLATELIEAEFEKGLWRKPEQNSAYFVPSNDSLFYQSGAMWHDDGIIDTQTIDASFLKRLVENDSATVLNLLGEDKGLKWLAEVNKYQYPTRRLNPIVYDILKQPSLSAAPVAVAGQGIVDSQPLIDAAIESGGGKEALKAVVPLVRIRYGPVANMAPMVHENGVITINKEVLDFIATRWPKQAQAYINRVLQEELIHAVAHIALTVEEKRAIGESMTELDKQRLNRPEIDQMFNRSDQAYHYGSEFINYILGGPDVEIPIDPSSTLGQRVIAALRKVAAYLARAIQDLRARIQRSNPMLDEALMRVTRTIDEINAGVIKAFPTDSQDPLNARAIKDALRMFEAKEQDAPGSGESALRVAQAGEIVAQLPQAQLTLADLRTKASTGTSRTLTSQQRFARDVAQRVLRVPFIRKNLVTQTEHLEASINALNGDLETFERLNADSNATLEEIKTAAGNAFETLQMFEQSRLDLFKNIERLRPQLIKQIAKTFDAEAEALASRDTNEVLFKDFQTLGRLLMKAQKDKAVLSAYKQAMDNKVATRNVITFLNKHMDFSGMTYDDLRSVDDLWDRIRLMIVNNTGKFKTWDGSVERVIGASEDVIRSVLRIVALSEPIRTELEAAKTMADGVQYAAPFDRIKTKLGQELRAGNYDGSIALYEKGLVDTGINLKESRDAANFFTKNTRRLLVNIKTLDEAKAIADKLSADPELIRKSNDVYKFHNIAKITHGTPEKGLSTTIEFLRANPADKPIQIEFGNTQEEFQRSFEKAVMLLSEYQAYIANPDVPGYNSRIAAGMERDIDLLGWFTDPSRNPKVRARLLPGFSARTFDWISSKLGHFALIPKFATTGAVGHLADVESTARTAWSTVEEKRGIILMAHKADLDTTLKAALKSHRDMNPGEYDLKVLAPLAASRQNFNNAGILKPGDGIGNGETVTAEDMRYLKAWRAYENDLYDLVNSTGKYKFQSVKMMFAGILFDKNGMVRTPVTHGPNDMGRDFRPVMQEWVKDWFAGDTAKRIALIDFWKDPLLIGYIRGSREVDWKGGYAYPLETREIAREMGDNPITSLEDYVQRVFDIYIAREGVEPKDMDEIQADVLADFDAIFKKIKPFAEQGGDNPKTDLEIIGGNNSFNTPRSVTIMPPGWYVYGGVTVGDRVAMGRQATIGFQLAYRKALEALRDSLAAVVTGFEGRRKVGGVTESQQYAASKAQRMSGDILYDLGEAERLLQNTDNLLTHFKAIMSRSANPYVKDSVHMAAMRGGAQFVITSVVSGPAAVTKNLGGGYQNLAMMDVILRRKNVLWSLATRGPEIITDRLKELIYLTVHEGNPATRNFRKLLENTQNVAFIGDVAKLFLGYANKLRTDYDYAKEAGVNYNIDLWATTKAKWKFSKTLGEPRANDPGLYEGWANQLSLVGNIASQYVGQATVGFADVRLNTKAIMEASSIEQNFREIAIQFGDKIEASGLFPDKAVNKGALGADVGAAVIRDIFRRGGVGSIDAIMADFYRRWVEDKASEQEQGLPEGALSAKTRLFTDPQYRQLEMMMAEEVNLATGSTRPTFGKQSKAHSKLMVLWGWPSWFIQKLLHLADGLSNKRAFVSNMPTLIQIALLLVLTAPLIYGASAFIKRFFENKVTGFPTVFDAQNPQQAAQAILAATADSIPFIGSAFNAVSGAGYRTGFDINSQFLFLNLAGDAMRTYKEVVQTGDLGAPMQRFAGRYFFPVNIVGGRLPNMSGMREFSNARNILVMGARGTGLETKLRRVGGDGGTTANYSASTPFVNEAINAIGRGDDAGFQSAYARLVDQKRSTGSLNPASAALTALRSRSPISSVFGTRLEPEELSAVYSNVSPQLAMRARSTIDRFERAIAGLPRRATTASRGLGVGRTRRTRAVGFRSRRIGRLRTPSLRVRKPRLRRLALA